MSHRAFFSASKPAVRKSKLDALASFDFRVSISLYPNSFFNNSCTIWGLAWPRVAFITAPRTSPAWPFCHCGIAPLAWIGSNNLARHGGDLVRVGDLRQPFFTHQSTGSLSVENISARISCPSCRRRPFSSGAAFRQMRGRHRRLRDFTARFIEQMEQFTQHPIGGQFGLGTSPGNRLK